MASVCFPVYMEDPLSKRLKKFDDPIESPERSLIYMTTNETVPTDVRTHLATKPIIARSCHIGFSGWHNLDIMAIRHSSYGLLCDINPDETAFLIATFQLIKESPDRIECAKKLIHYIHTLPSRIMISYNFRSDSTEEEITDELTREDSWLGSNEAFNYIRSLVLKGKIVAITKNIKDTESFKKITTLLQNNGIQVDSIYLSNICHYMDTKSDQTAFVESISSLMESDTSVISCPVKHRMYRSESGAEVDLGADKGTILSQHVMLGKELRSSPESFFDIKIPYSY